MDIALFYPENAVGKKIQHWFSSGASCSVQDKSNPVFDQWATQLLQCRSLPAATSSVALTSSNKETFVAVGNRSTQALGGQPVVYGSPYKPLPPITAHRKDSAGSKRAEFEEAKRTGKIHVTPYLVATLTVKDDPIVESAAAEYVTLPWNAFPGDITFASSRYACNRMLYNFGGGELEYYPRPNFVTYWYIGGRYKCYKDVKLKSALAPYRKDVSVVLNDIAEAIQKRAPDSGLVTSGTAALNAGIMDALTTLAEMPETVRFIFDGLKTILAMRRAAVRRATDIKATVKNAEEQVTRLAELWMSFRYGIMPIVYSVNDAVSILEQKGVFRTVRQHIPSSLVVSIRGIDTVIPLTERYWGKARVDMDSNLADLQLNLLATAWELVPLSFVMDWVVNTGDFLTSLFPPSAAQEVKHTYSWRSRATIPLNFGGVFLQGNLELYHTQPINHYDHIGLTVDFGMSWKRWLDALALSWFAAKNLK